MDKQLNWKLPNRTFYTVNSSFNGRYNLTSKSPKMILSTSSRLRSTAEWECMYTPQSWTYTLWTMRCTMRLNVHTTSCTRPMNVNIHTTRCTSRLNVHTTSCTRRLNVQTYTLRGAWMWTTWRNDRLSYILSYIIYSVYWLYWQTICSHTSLVAHKSD